MTVPNISKRNDYVGDGATSVFPYSFRILDASEIRVLTLDPDTNIQTLLTLNTDYTVDGVGSAGGNVTLTAGNLADGHPLTIRRYRNVIQDADFRNVGSFLPESVEDALDKLCMELQSVHDEVDRCIKFQEIEAGSNATTIIPVRAARAGYLIGFDDDGDITMETSSGHSGPTVQELSVAPVPGGPAQFYRIGGVLKYFDGSTSVTVGLSPDATSSYARAVKTSNQSVLAGATDKVAFQSKTFDLNSEFDATTNYRFTAQTAGVYQVSVNLGLTTDSGPEVFLYKNGSAYSKNIDKASALSDLVSLGVGDYVEVFYNNSTGSTVTIYASGNIASYISIVKIK